MGASSFDRKDPRVQLEITKETLKHFETKFRKQEHDLDEANISLKQKEAELKQAIEERYKFYTQQELLKLQVAYMQLSLNQSKEKLTQAEEKLTQKEEKNIRTSRLSEVLQFVAAGLASAGVSMLLIPPLYIYGWIVVIFAFVEFLIAILIKF